MEYRRNIMVTGGAGFIGSHLVRHLVTKYPDYRIVNVDKLTYAGNLANLKDIEDKSNYVFVKADICDADAISSVFRRYAIDGVIHLAAESHVDRSIKDPFVFAKTNVLGTLNMLYSARMYWESLPERYETNCFITYRLMRSMAHLLSTALCLPNKPNISLTAHILHLKPRRIILSGLFMILTICLL